MDERLPNDIICKISDLLCIKDKARFACVCKSMRTIINIDEMDIQCVLLTNIIKGPISQYSFFSNVYISNDGVHVTYLLNVYSNFIVLFQKFKSHTSDESCVKYDKVLTLDKNTINKKNICYILNIFNQIKPLVSDAMFQRNIATFLGRLNHE